jgi:hypothetical protein
MKITLPLSTNNDPQYMYYLRDNNMGYYLRKNNDTWHNRIPRYSIDNYIEELHDQLSERWWEPKYSRWIDANVVKVFGTHEEVLKWEQEHPGYFI